MLDSSCYANKGKLLAVSMGPIVPQLSKCLKFKAVWGVLTDQMI